MNQINFLPASYQDSVLRRRRQPRNFIAVLITATALVGVWQFTPRSEALGHRADELEMQLVEVDELEAQAAKIKQELTAVQTRRAIAREISQPVSATQVLATIAQVAPTDVKLTNVQLVAHRPMPAAAIVQSEGDSGGGAGDAEVKSVPSYLEITLNGIAPNEREVVAFIRTLNDHPLFSRVRSRSTGRIQTSRVIACEFEITLRVDLDREFVPTQQSQEGRDAS